MRANGVIEDSNNHFVDNATRAKLNSTRENRI
jgi:hypothetical protein